MIWQKQRVRNNEQWRVHNKTITVQYANNHYNLQQLIQKIQNDCTNTDSTNSVHHKMSTHNGIVLEPTIEECSCATTHDARNAMFEPISECSVYGLWRRPRRVARQRVPKSKRRKATAVPSPFGGSGHRLLLTSCFYVGQLLLQRWPASASGRHPWRAHGLTQRSTIEWGSPRWWVFWVRTLTPVDDSDCSNFVCLAVVTFTHHLEHQIAAICFTDVVTDFSNRTGEVGMSL